jgi:hypothetical protein
MAALGVLLRDWLKSTAGQTVAHHEVSASIQYELAGYLTERLERRRTCMK